MPPDPSSLGRFRRSQFPRYAYPLKISRYVPAMAANILSSIFWSSYRACLHGFALLSTLSFSSFGSDRGSYVLQIVLCNLSFILMLSFK